MNTHLLKPTRYLTIALATVLLSAGVVSAGPAQFVIVNINAPGVGFNDPAPAAPVGGNTGTTLGDQRLIAFAHAARIWSERLDSNVPIRIRAQFTPLGAGILGSAGPVAVASDFPNAPLPGTQYHIALANKLAGGDLAPALDDINANFTTAINFYLGLDNNHGTQNDLVTVLLHEFAHGLGFSQFANLTTGALFGGLPDVYNSSSARHDDRPDVAADGRRGTPGSGTRFGRVVWTGAIVTAGVPSVLSLGSPRVQVNSPANIAGPLQFGTAAFGPPLGVAECFGERDSGRGCGRIRNFYHARRHDDGRLFTFYERRCRRRQHCSDRTRAVRLRRQSKECDHCRCGRCGDLQQRGQCERRSARDGR